MLWLVLHMEKTVRNVSCDEGLGWGKVRWDRRSARRKVIAVSAAVVMPLLIGVVPTARAGLPGGATQISVSAGMNTSSIDAHLQARPTGSITGVVRYASDGSAVNFAVLKAYQGGHAVGDGFQDSPSGYTTSGLDTGTYKVCVDAGPTNTTRYDPAGPSPTGYLSRCYKDAPYGGFGTSPPSSATGVDVTDGEQTTDIDISLPAAAAIAGRVKTARGAVLPDDTVVRVYNRDTGARLKMYGFATGGNNDGDGTYKVIGLPEASHGYTVCFDPENKGFRISATGYLRRCYKNTPWNGTTVPSSATAVPVALGQTHTNVNVRLPAAGAVSGRVLDAKTGKPVSHVEVMVFSNQGRLLHDATNKTTGKGYYRIRGLPAARADHVCVAPVKTPVFVVNPTVSYYGKCWKSSRFNGTRVPTSADPVRVRLGHVHHKINLRLKRRPTGSISGRVTGQGSGTPLANVEVDLFRSGSVHSFIAEEQTSKTGAYRFALLTPNRAGYVVCVATTNGDDGTSPSTGWAPECYKHAAWPSPRRLPPGVRRVPLTARQHKTINLALPAGGEISGVTYAGDGTTQANCIDVSVFTARGHWVASTYHGADSCGASYSFTGLTPSTTGVHYIVCFDGIEHFDGGTRYLPQCYNDVPWDGTSP
jgi:5-hydroxyisourate hydrolase-like protein (transthyretin family)